LSSIIKLMSFRTTVKKAIPKGVFPAIEPYGHLGEGVLFNTLNGFPGKGMKVIGVTGTNGKTSTCFMIHHMLRAAGYKTGLMTTVAYGIDEDIRQQVHHMTSQPMPELMRRLKWMKSQGVEWLILETTSQALAQNRTWGVPYSVAVMTNLTHEHITYHGTFEKYRTAKVKLFRITNKNRKGLQLGIINADDPSAKYFAEAIAKPVTYGLKKGDITPEQVKIMPTGSTYTIKTPVGELHITCHIPGSFNVENSLAAVTVGLSLGLKPADIEKGIASLQSVEGRMVSIDEGQDFSVIVDYAHTPDSFEKLFKDLKPMVKGKIIVLFGSLGGGDKTKRALQGELAGQYADEVVVCQEDDRNEKPESIMNDIANGVEKGGKIRGKDLFLIHDRTEAIQFAVDRAGKNDTVLLLGKGHEKTLEDAEGEHPWDEVATAHAAVKKRLGK